MGLGLVRCSGALFSAPRLERRGAYDVRCLFFPLLMISGSERKLKFWRKTKNEKANCKFSKHSFDIGDG